MAQKPVGGVILNPGCRLKCLFCGGHERASEARIRYQERMVYRNLIEFRNRGIRKIAISGSDPIEYDFILPLIRYIKSMGFESVQLSTHGTSLDNDEFLDDIIAAGIDEFRIPIYGSNAGIHEAFTCSEGSFDKTLNGIRKIRRKAPDIGVEVSCLIVKQNKDDLANIIDLAKSLGVGFYFSIPFIMPDDKNYKSYYIPIQKLGPYVKKAYEYAKKINYRVNFLEIPFCVFGFIDESINNTCLPPDMGESCQPPESVKTEIKDLPSYRLKKKIDICSKCSASGRCDGFVLNDINEFGVGDIKPIL